MKKFVASKTLICQKIAKLPKCNSVQKVDRFEMSLLSCEEKKLFLLKRRVKRGFFGKFICLMEAHFLSPQFYVATEN